MEFERTFDVTAGVCDELSPLIRRVLCDNPSPFTFKGTSSFIVGRGTVALIDPGPDDPAHLAALLAAVRGETVSHVLVTHTHRDHSPLAAGLKAATGAQVLAMPLAARGEDAGVRLDAAIDTGFAADRALAHGDRVEGPGWTLECLHTPGHMSNHLAFALREERTLFAGDHVMAWSTSVIAPPDGDMGRYLDSLRLLLARDDAVYHPAHGPSRRDPKPLVRGLLAHRKMREEAIFSRVEAGDGALEEIVSAVYAGLDPRLLAAAGLSALAHLRHLVERGRIREVDGRYLPA